jgi:Heavy metal binding domain
MPRARIAETTLDRRQVLRALTAGAIGATAFFCETPVRAKDAPDEEIAWVCPMHASYTATTAGTCPICGMQLIQTRPYDTRDYRLEFHTEPAQVRPGEKVTLFFRFLHPGTGAVVRHFEVVHTKPFHLFVISQDLEFFEHIHPTMRDDGTWTIETSVPKAGYYQVLCDFMPSGGSGQFLTAALVTANYTGDLATDSAHLTPDTVLRKSDGDLTAALSFNPVRPMSCQYAHLTFDLTDTATGRPVTDLQTYLGQFSHMLLMSEDMQSYVHSHPINLIVGGEDAAQIPEYIIAPDADLATIRGGPQVTFDALLPKAGRFRAWAQFQRNDQVHTLAFTFNVAQGSAEPTLA